MSNVVFYKNIEEKWTELLLNWLNKCVVRKNVYSLNFKSFGEIINKYKNDVFIGVDNIDVKTFITKKFPLLKLSINKHEYKQFYILTSVLLYFCCINSKNGQVDKDIRKNLTNVEQKMILKFCEALADVDMTVHNVESAINGKNILTTAMKLNIEIVILSNFIDACITSNQKGINLKDIQTDSTITSSSKDTKRAPTLKFKSSITVLPSVTATETSLSDPEISENSDLRVAYLETGASREIGAMWNAKNVIETQNDNTEEINQRGSSDHICQADCACTRCSFTGPCCGDPGGTIKLCDDSKSNRKNKSCIRWKSAVISTTVILLVFVISIPLISILMKPNSVSLHEKTTLAENSQKNSNRKWTCNNNFCHRVFHDTLNIVTYSSLNRCILQCTGLQIWPYPNGRVYYNNTIVDLTTKKMKYNFLSTPSSDVQKYLAEAFKIFLNDLANLERSGKFNNKDNALFKIEIQVRVENDPDPRLRINTEEAYVLKLDTINEYVLIRISADSFCGVRNGIETLLQLIVLDQSRGNLISYSNIFISDAPAFKYRGLMIDTARNFIPVVDLMRTIDAMATCKLNTLHWRISDVTSFPLQLDKVPELSEYGSYSKSMVYTRSDVKFLVKSAGVRGIRILIEVAAPDPVGRPWSWFPGITCPKTNNTTCDNILCLGLSLEDSVFDLLENIYSEIINLTSVDDVFHLSNGIFSITKCHDAVNGREGFLNKALQRLRLANKGVLPKLPIVWYTSNLKKEFDDGNIWERFVVQLNDWDSDISNQDLTGFRVIHSAKWDLSCEMNKKRCTKYNTWQQMYAWKSWRNINAFSTEGGESILWTDLVDSSNLDHHLWPRAAVVSERLWSDTVANSTAKKHVYMRLDSFRRRMAFRGINVHPIWPWQCSSNPSFCLQKVN